MCIRDSGEDLDGWETNEILDQPTDLVASVSRGRAELAVREPDDIDHDFAALVDAVEPLKQFIDKCCEPHNLT